MSLFLNSISANLLYFGTTFATDDHSLIKCSCILIAYWQRIRKSSPGKPCKILQTLCLKAERNDVMGSILESDDMEGMKGTLVIAVNVDQKHYPYSSLAFRSDPQLFESSYLQIKN